MKKKIVSLSPLNTEILRMMIKGAGVLIPADIEILSANMKSESEILDMVKDADIIMGDYTFNIKITREMAFAAKKAKLIQQPSVGYQSIDIDACAEAGIPVANTAGANTTSVAEHTIMAGLCLVKKLIPAHKATSAGEWKQMDIGASELHGKLWGIIGMGRIGRSVAERLVSFGVRIVYHDVVKMDEDGDKQFNASFMEIDEILRTADIISFHCPLTDVTRGLINAKNLSMMKATSVIINAARGEVIDETALADALREKRIGGAALDVYSDEPILKNNPLLEIKDANLILTPHIAGVTNEAKIRIISAAVNNIVNVLNGNEPDFVVNRMK